MASSSTLHTTPTSVSGDGSTITHYAPNHSGDYDWVLPVVVVFAILILLLFISMIFLIYKRYRDSSYKRTRQCVCDCQHQRQENYQLRAYNGHRRHTMGTLNVGLSNYTPGTRREPDHSSLSDRDPEMNARTRDRSASFGHDMPGLNTHPSDGHESSCLSECASISVGISPSLFPLVGTETKNLDESERNLGTNDFSNHEQSNNSQSRDQYLRHESTQSDCSGNVVFYLGDLRRSGVENEAFSDSDFDSRPSRNVAAAIASRKDHRLEKSVTVTGLRNRSDTNDQRNYLDRQVSNQSVPAYPHDVGFSTELSQPIGKFETVYDLASSKNYEEVTSSRRGNFAAKMRKGEEIEVEHNDMSRGTDTVTQICDQGESTSRLINNKMAYEIPTIILPKGGYIDYDSENDKMSFYNSSSLESGMSTPPRTHRRARANNPFCIEARPPYVGNMTRSSSAPTIPYSRQQSIDLRDLLGEMTRSASGYWFTPGGTSHGLFPDLRRDSSRSWSEELYDVIREAGVTDADHQQRMKKMIDARYSYIFDKKYPELNSLYPSLQNRRQPDRRLTPKKKKLKSKKRRRPLSKNDSSGSDQYDRLKPPDMFYSERRPARFIREGPYGEDRKTKPDNIPHPKSRKSQGISLGQSSSDNNMAPLHNSGNSAFLSLPESRDSARIGSNSSNADPLYESIPSPQSSFCHSSPNSSIDFGHAGDNVIYDRIRESKDRNKTYPNGDVDKVDSAAPIPPSTKPPIKPKPLRLISKSYPSGRSNVASLPSVNSVTVGENFPEVAPDETSGTCVTHTSNTITESSSGGTTTTAIYVPDDTNEGIPKDSHGNFQSVNWLASSSDTPLEHPLSKFNNSYNGGPHLADSLSAAQDGLVCSERTDSLGATQDGLVCSERTDSLGAIQDGLVCSERTDSLSLSATQDGLVCSERNTNNIEFDDTSTPYQRRTFPTNYDDSIQISRV